VLVAPNWELQAACWRKSRSQASRCEKQPWQNGAWTGVCGGFVQLGFYPARSEVLRSSRTLLGAGGTETLVVTHKYGLGTAHADNCFTPKASYNRARGKRSGVAAERHPGLGTEKPEDDPNGIVQAPVEPLCGSFVCTEPPPQGGRSAATLGCVVQPLRGTSDANDDLCITTRDTPQGGLSREWSLANGHIHLYSPLRAMHA